MWRRVSRSPPAQTSARGRELRRWLFGCGRGVEPPSSAYETDERTGSLNRRKPKAAARPRIAREQPRDRQSPEEAAPGNGDSRDLASQRSRPDRCIQPLLVSSALLLLQDVGHKLKPATVRNPVQVQAQRTRMLMCLARNGRSVALGAFAGCTKSCLANDCRQGPTSARLGRL